MSIDTPISSNLLCFVEVKVFPFYRLVSVFLSGVDGPLAVRILYVVVLDVLQYRDLHTDQSVRYELFDIILTVGRTSAIFLGIRHRLSCVEMQNFIEVVVMYLAA